MSKRIALMATVAALAIGPAMAQQQTEPAKPDTSAQQQQAPQQQTPPAATTKPMDSDTQETDKSASETMPSESSQAAADAREFIPAQESGQWLASTLIGTNVTGSDNENIGSIQNLLLDENGQVAGVVIGVGGFLGIGQKEVAVPFDALNLMKDADGKNEARISLTKAELEDAPDFKTAEEMNRASRQPASPGGATPPAGNR